MAARSTLVFQPGDRAALAISALQYQNQLNYSRDFEREADRLGIQIMSRAGFDPNGMVGFFEHAAPTAQRRQGAGLLQTIADDGTDRNMQNRVETVKTGLDCDQR
jgi:predicted Zn-dependent protease